MLSVNSTYITKIAFIIGNGDTSMIDKDYWKKDSGLPLELPNAGNKFRYEHSLSYLDTALMRICVRCEQALQEDDRRIWFETSHFQTNSEETSVIWVSPKGETGEWSLTPVYENGAYKYHTNVFKYKIEYGAKDKNGRAITSRNVTAGINDYKFIIKANDRTTVLFETDTPVKPMIKMEMLEYPRLYPYNSRSTFHYVMMHQEVMQPGSVDATSTYGQPVNVLTEDDIIMNDRDEQGAPANLEVIKDGIEYKYEYNEKYGQNIHIVDIAVKQTGYLDRASGLVWMEAKKDVDDEWCR